MQGDLTFLKGGENLRETVESPGMQSSPHFLPRLRAWLFVLAGLVLLSSSCQADNAQLSAGKRQLPAWQYRDLRRIDPADSRQPEADILAVYLRVSPGSRQETRLEIRLDLLSYRIEEPAGWLVALDHAPGGQNMLPNGNPAGRSWDSLLVISDNGSIRLLDTALQPRPAPAIRVLRDAARQQIEISLNLSALPAARAGLWAQVFSTGSEPLTSTVVDLTQPAALHGMPPEPVPLLLAFWNAFPAYTPAQALRRWDGAHTGPAGGRHGLYNLLRASRNHALPLALLDLSAPEALSALDYAGGLELVRQLERSRLLILPAWQPAQDAGCEVYTAHQAALRFDLPLYPASSEDLLVLINETNPLPEVQLDEHGLSEQARSLLANTAYRQGDTLVVLGGSLPASRWGIPDMARSAMAEIRSRPWIRPVNAYSLANWLPAWHFSNQPAGPATGSLQLAYLQACSALQAPIFPVSERLSELRSRYQGQLAVLQYAAGWENSPAPASDCTQDLDSDGGAECLLASESVLAVFQASSAALSYLFVRDAAGVHQLVAPTSQSIIGQSDPKAWRFETGAETLLSDPTVIPGAFLQPEPCQTKTTSSTIDFSCRKVSLQYHLTSAGLAVSIRSGDSAPIPEMQLPIAVDPWLRFAPGWGSRFTHVQRGESLIAGYPPAHLMRLRANQPFQVDSFDATLSQMGTREDPNTEFPPGHYLPFPFLLVHFSISDSLEIFIELEKQPSGL